jgi:hypothetical protein
MKNLSAFLSANVKTETLKVDPNPQIQGLF